MTFFDTAQRPKLQTILMGKPAKTQPRFRSDWILEVQCLALIKFQMSEVMASEGTVLCCTVLWTVGVCSYGILFELEH